MKNHPNLVRRDGLFYYRASFSLDGKAFLIRLSLKTAVRSVARERAAWMDRILKDRWQNIVNEQDGIGEADKASILRAAALKVRDGLETLHANEQASGHDDAEDAALEHLRTLRGLDYIARDIFTNGIGPSFGSYDHFSDRFVQGMPYLDGDQLQRIQEILSNGALLVAASDDGAKKALTERNIRATPANVVLARRQMMLGALLALREAEKQALAPAEDLDQLLASLEMPVGAPPTTSVATHDYRHGAAGHVHADAAVGMSTVAASIVATAPSASEPAGTGGRMTIAAAAKAFLAANPKFDQGFASSRWTDKTRSQFDSAIFLAAKFFGQDVAIAEIDESMMAELFRTLRRLPPNHHKTPAHAGMTLAEIVASNRGEGLSLATTNRHMRFLKLIFDWAGRRMANRPIIDWGAFVEADSRVKRDKRLAFTTAELQALFQGAVWSGSESKTRRVKPGFHVWHDSAYWVPILLAYTGARREEVAKAIVDDITMIGDVWVLRIRETETGRVKTASSVRDVPLAEEVLRLGFLDFVEQRRQTGVAALFPELASGGSNYGDAFYKKWWRAFMRAGLVPEGKDMHSMRHYVATALAEHDVSEERRADLLGHTILTSETARTYTKRTPLRIMRDVVNKIPNVTGHLDPMPIKLP